MAGGEQEERWLTIRAALILLTIGLLSLPMDRSAKPIDSRKPIQSPEYRMLENRHNVVQSRAEEERRLKWLHPLFLHPRVRFHHNSSPRWRGRRLRQRQGLLRSLRRSRQELIAKTHIKTLIALARHFIGLPYVYGGTTPRGFDCSGLVQYVYRHVGVYLPRTTYAQYGRGISVPRNSLRPADVVFFNSLGHEGLYLGRGRFIESPHTGASVRISPFYSRGGYVGARRMIRVHA